MIVDSNILIDWIDGALPDHASGELLAQAARGSLIANEVIFAEIAGRYDTMEAALGTFAAFELQIVRLSLDDCFVAGRAFRQYRRNGGVRQSILSDFLIGAQAALRGWPLVTRDRKGFATYFPEVELIDPYTAEP